MPLRSMSAALSLVVALGLVGPVLAQQEKTALTAPVGKTGDDADKSAPTEVKTEKATFGGGCFWCLEAVFERIAGVKSVVSGYAGGHVKRPSYALVCTGTTGHAEVVQIEFDPKVVSYEKLLDVFWLCHDPTTLNRQGPDEGTQYRSIILFHDEEQKRLAQQSYKKVTATGVYKTPIVTELVPLTMFYVAEKHHQDYYRRNKNAPYCRMTIAPKLQEMQYKLQSTKLPK